MSARLAVTIPVVLALASLAACASPEELRRRDEAACASYGFRPGTTEFATCLQRESLARRYQTTATDYSMWGSPWGPGPYRWR